MFESKLLSGEEVDNVIRTIDESIDGNLKDKTIKSLVISSEKGRLFSRTHSVTFIEMRLRD